MKSMTLLLSSILSVSSMAAEPKRLVELSPGGEQRWMSVSEMDRISHEAHEAGRCGGYMDVTKYPEAKRMKFVEPLLNYTGLKPTQHAIVQPLVNQVDPAGLIKRVTELSVYQNRFYDRSATGVAAANWIRDEFARMADSRSDIQVAAEKHDFTQTSVIATIPGTGPKKDEIVVLGGHLDSINHKGLLTPHHKRVAPGADDNASGIATLMETYRLLVESGFRPNRTIQFMGYAGEEKGLLGSQDIAERYREEKKVVVAALQLDMTMFPGSTPRISFVRDFTDDGLTVFTQKLVDEYVKVKWVEDKCGYACSDHASWHRNGFPAVHPAEATLKQMNRAIHTTEDTIEKLDPTHGTHFIKLALAFAVEIGNAP